MNVSWPHFHAEHGLHTLLGSIFHAPALAAAWCRSHIWMHQSPTGMVSSDLQMPRQVLWHISSSMCRRLLQWQQLT